MSKIIKKSIFRFKLIIFSYFSFQNKFNLNFKQKSRFINMSSDFFSNSPDWVLNLRRGELAEELKARGQLGTGLKSYF